VKVITSFPSVTERQWIIPETSANKTALSSCITAGDENTGLPNLCVQRMWPSSSAREEHVPSSAAAYTALATQGEEQILPSPSFADQIKLPSCMQDKKYICTI